MNPAALMKIMNAKKQFQTNHPKFVSFLNAVFSGGVEEGTVIEITVTKPGQKAVTSNIRVQPSDLELLGTLGELGK